MTTQPTNQRTFLWFSDIHLDPFYGSRDAVDHSGDCTLPNKTLTHPFGDFGCDAPQRLVESLLQQAVEVASDADFVVITGDLSRHGNDWLSPNPLNDTQTILQKVSTLLRSELGTEIPIVVALGNNDVTPDYFLDWTQPEEMLQMVSQGLRPLFFSSLPSSTANASNNNDDGDALQRIQQFQEGGFYAQNVTDSVTVLSLNTVLYSTNHQPLQQSFNNPDPLGQFAWLTEQLDLATQANRSVYLIGHIPPAIGSYRHSQLWHDTYLEQYYSIVSNRTNVVKAQLFGHIHTDEFRVHLGQSLLLTSSFTPIYGSNPSFRIVTYKQPSGDLLDSTVWYMDLALVNDADADDKMNDSSSANNNAALWQQAESFTQAFQVPGLSFVSLEMVVQDLINSTDHSIYWEALLTRLHVYTHGVEVCDATCRHEWACTLSSLTRQQYDTCFAPYASSSSFWDVTPMWANLFFLVSFVGLFFGVGVVRFLRRFQRRRHYRVSSMNGAELELTEEDANGDFVLDGGGQGLPDLA